MTEDEVKTILEENLRLAKETNEMVRKIKKHIAWQKAISVFYLLMFVIPLILSLIYLPPLLSGVFSQYSQLLGTVQPAANPAAGGGTNVNSVLKMLNETKSQIEK